MQHQDIITPGLMVAQGVRICRVCSFLREEAAALEQARAEEEARVQHRAAGYCMVSFHSHRSQDVEVNSIVLTNCVLVGSLVMT